MINSTDYSDGALKRLHNPLYGTTPAQLSPIRNIPQIGQSEGTDPAYEPIKLSSNHSKTRSRANGETTSLGKSTSCSDMYIPYPQLQLNTVTENLKTKQKVENQYQLLGKDESEEEVKTHSEEEANNQYHLLSNAETNRTQESNVYHFAGRVGVEDYEDPEMEGIENVYHILEGPTPERGEYNENFYEVPVMKRN